MSRGFKKIRERDRMLQEHRIIEYYRRHEKEVLLYPVSHV
jgi:hypothetical protein